MKQYEPIINPVLSINVELLLERVDKAIKDPIPDALELVQCDCILMGVYACVRDTDKELWKRHELLDICIAQALALKNLEEEDN